ncbi:MAG: flagellar type III secretion system pore protein FliP [Rhodospirillaceae bacterium]|nr:flagellar type III secretion system pore protein FliP [Rhodospirillaceae bacterium]MBT4589124.1 flagellar type III secretion system pore protein FliP [Rhodospirillaceae bacterium]
MTIKGAFFVRLFIALAGGLVLSDPVLAQAFSLDLGQGGPTATERLIQLFLLITVMALAPSILVMTTSFIRIVIVLSFLRTAMGAQQTPPNQVLMALALFLTFFIMSPTFEAAWEQGVRPYVDGEIEEKEAFERSLRPLQNFMQKFVRDQDLKLFMDIANIPPVATPNDIPAKVLIPAFIISELRRAFEIGFLVFIPFLVIDMVVASVLMSMGMMMLPPIIIALPFKIIFFVLVDGWFLIVGSLVQSFGALGP